MGRGAHSFFYRSAASLESRPSPEKADERGGGGGGGGGGGTPSLFSDLKLLGSNFQTQSRGASTQKRVHSAGELT